MAANVTDVEDLKKNVDDIFLLTNAVFVCLMQCGFACLEAGSVRSKNVTNIIMKNVFDIFISALCYWLIGYAVAYGPGNSFLGLEYFAGVGLPHGVMAHWFFQMIFAATAATIISGAVAERCNFYAYITYSAVISGFVYPVVSHWVWSEEGWLLKLGYQDFAGSGAVHLLGGTCSLVGAAFLGPRIGRFPTKNAINFQSPGVENLTGHSTPLVGIGGMILIAGFLAFNGGSLGRMSQPGDGDAIAQVIANTVLGGSGGGLSVLVAAKAGLCGPRSWSFAMSLNAALTGMVSVCGGVNEMELWSSFVSGLIAGPVFLVFRAAVIRCRVDDPLDAVAVHLGGGLWGLISASIFSNTGLVFGANHESGMLFAYRMIGAVAIFVWSAAWCSVMFGILKVLGYLRASPEAELEGLDTSMHNEAAYPPSAWGINDLPSARFHTQKFQVTQLQDNANKIRPMTEYSNMAFVDTESAVR